MIYTEKLHPALGEIAIHVQSFLGCDDHDFGDDDDTRLPIMIEWIDDPSASLKENVSLQNRMRLRLKRSLQLYTYRLFLLDAVAELVENFVGAARTQGPRLDEIEALEFAPSERRELERRLKALKPYTGFTANLELSFDYNGAIYVYEIRSEFMNEFLAIMSEVDVGIFPGGGFEDDVVWTY